MKMSIVIPVYNGSGFIQKSYDSIINQDLNDFEIIYVDSGSDEDNVKLSLNSGFKIDLT